MAAGARRSKACSAAGSRTGRLHVPARQTKAAGSRPWSCRARDAAPGRPGRRPGHRRVQHADRRIGCGASGAQEGLHPRIIGRAGDDDRDRVFQQVGCREQRRHRLERRSGGPERAQHRLGAASPGRVAGQVMQAGEQGRDQAGAGRGRVVGGAARARERHVGRVGGGLEEAAVGIGEVRDGRLRQGHRLREPGRIAGRLMEREGARDRPRLGPPAARKR